MIFWGFSMATASLPTDTTLQALAQSLGTLCQARGICLSTAESCTGGWVAKVLTDIAGSSHWFERGFITYSNQAKQELLAVPAATLARAGAVSEAVVGAMARGAIAHSRADFSLAISGIAGPSGGSAKKPVGTVWLAWASRSGGELTRLAHLPGNREAVRRQAVMLGLRGLFDIIELATP